MRICADSLKHAVHMTTLTGQEDEVEHPPRKLDRVLIIQEMVILILILHVLFKIVYCITFCKLFGVYTVFSLHVNSLSLAHCSRAINRYVKILPTRLRQAFDFGFVYN